MPKKRMAGMNLSRRKPANWLGSFAISAINRKSVNLSALRKHDRYLIRMGEVEGAPRLLVQHILVDGAVAQHAHPLLEVEPFGAHLVTPRLQYRRLRPRL